MVPRERLGEPFLNGYTTSRTSYRASFGTRRRMATRHHGGHEAPRTVCGTGRAQGQTGPAGA